MLRHRMLQEQTFENLILEAKKQIPLYTNEWTNFNPSDPAQTVLENLSAFTILQQAYIDRMPEQVQEKLFTMAGFSRQSGRNARVLLEAKNVEEPVRLPAGQRFRVGELYFETNRECNLYGYGIRGMYTRMQDTLIDLSGCLRKENPTDVLLFTEQPKMGMEWYLVLDGMPEAGEEILFYIKLAKEFQRNAFTGENLFAELQWQCYTEKGFVNIRAKDYTGALLSSGELRLRMPKEKLAVYEELPERGYVFRAVLKRADYDIPPRIAGISSFLFEVWQKETKSICYTYGKEQQFSLFSDILEDGYVQIFCKEEKDGPYYAYQQTAGNSGQQAGRFYRMERLGYGMYVFTFDKEAFGFAPGKFENAVKLVAYSEEIMKQYHLGMLYGYDDQEILLPEKHMVKDGFHVIVERLTEAGEKMYYFIKPDSQKDGDLCYTLLENEGILRVQDAGDFVGCRVLLGGCAVSGGAEGNIRAESVFTPIGYETDAVFINPSAGSGGRFTETIAQVRRRLIEDLRKHYTAVEAVDYENLVRTTPELCIHKVKAVRDAVKNRIQVAVKPMSQDPFPKLSVLYQKAIRERLEQARLLAVNIDICQPVYVPVYVRGTIYVKPHYEGSREQIEAVIRKQLDYISTERNFGERFHFDTLFQMIEALPCVNYIYELSVTPQNLLYASQKGLDLQPRADCLLYPGEILLELNTTE